MAVATAVSGLESCTPKLEDAGFQRLVYEDFYDVLISLINQVVTPEADGTELTIATLVEAFQSPEGTWTTHPSRNTLTDVM
jgi:ubiquitin thioesterase protein OTUB1